MSFKTTHNKIKTNNKQENLEYMMDNVNFAYIHCKESLKNVTVVSFSSVVRLISDKAFKGCTSLNNINLTPTLVSTDIHAFNGCTSLGNITLQTSLTLTSKGVFFQCKTLGNITLSSSLILIGDYAFDG